MHAKYLVSNRIILFIKDEQLVKKILKHLDLWDVKRKPSPRANGPPPEAFIICDESSSPGPDDPTSLLKLRRTCYFLMLITRWKPTFKNTAAGRVVSYTRICRFAQLHVRKSKLITTPASVISMGIGSV